MRKLNSNASSVGVMLILIPVILMITLTFISAGVVADQEAVLNIPGVIQLPNGYNDMTEQERSTWLQDEHDGYRERNAFRFGDPFWGYGHIYNDDFSMSIDDWVEFIEGRAEDIDVANVLFNFLTLNIPLLNTLGFAGVCVKAIMVVGIVIGLVDILWIG